MPPKIDGDAKPRRQYKLKEKPAEMEPPKPRKQYVLKKDIEALAKKVARRKVAKALLERIAKKREAKKEDPYSVSMAINDEIRHIARKAVMKESGMTEDEAEEYLDENLTDVLEELGGGYGVYDEMINHIVRVLKPHYRTKELISGMKYLREDGYTMFDDWIEEHE